MHIDNRTFLVTGGASGLGAATARMFVAAGGRVAIADMNREAGAALATELGQAARFVFTDVADEASGQAAVDSTVSAFGALHGLVNCAGVAPAEKVLGKHGPPGLAAFARVVQINLIGAFNMIRQAATAMARNEADETGERGVIVNT
ncbi:MAG: SDR family NAD(P)-dependent oxidoreductase, partial [Candidatus Competibacter sp.]|nr:SDR family NAD(P)-dependent oxidoreductase [Candidatus Competibacter sp.]